MTERASFFNRIPFSIVFGMVALGVMLQGFGPVYATEERIIPLDGQPNFRDLGGYKTLYGKRVRKGILYRSGELPKLSDEDIKILENLDIKTVVNFLTPKEIETRGKDRLPEGVKEVFEPIEEGNAEELALMVLEARQTGDFSKIPVELNAEIHELLIDLGASQYAALIREIIHSESIPLVFHCSHGVHRTGTAAAIILSLLGVPWETVRADYLLSNQARAKENQERIAELKSLAAKNQGISKEAVDATNIKAFYILEGDYIDASLKAIEKQYGSVEDYAGKKLGLTDVEIRQLKNILLD